MREYYSTLNNPQSINMLALILAAAYMAENKANGYDMVYSEYIYNEEPSIIWG
jgi:hypothetical protein